MSAPTSRLARMVRTRLGDAIRSAFVHSCVNRRYKVAFVRAFTRRVLGWVGPVEGGGCPHACAVDFDAPDATDKLACMHLDHERPVHVTCARWAAALPRPTRRTHGFGMCVGGY